jgi:hypothetical protein
MPFPAEDLSGRVFGRWTVLRRAVEARKNATMWLCLCDPAHAGCGAKHAVAAGTLKDGRSNGCRKCAAFQRHIDNPTAYLRGPEPKNHKHKCETCRKAFQGIERQRFCSPSCWPSAQPDAWRLGREAKKQTMKKGSGRER